MIRGGRIERRPGVSAESEIGSEIVAAGKYVIKKRPVAVSLWVVGLLLGAFASGFSVSQDAVDFYAEKLEEVNHVTDREWMQATRMSKDAYARYRSVKGWFWSCDAECTRAYQKYEMAASRLAQVEGKRESLVREAREKVGIWSTYGVADVRNRFWAAWEEGKELAKRWTMMDGMFMMFSGDRERTLVQVVMQLIMQYLSNLTVGLISAMCFFLYRVGWLVYAYGENMFTGLVFFGLVVIAVLSVVGTYVGALGGTVLLGTRYVVRKEQERIAGGGERARVANNGQQRRPHYE